MAYYYYYYPARACSLLLLLQPVYYLWFMAPHTTAALSFSYNFSTPGDLDRANLTYLSGNSTADHVHGIISLTDGFNSSGGVIYPQPVRLWDHRTGRRASFTTDFSFTISGNNTHRGDGMAFFIGSSRQDPPQDSDGGLLGLISHTTNGDTPPLSTVGIEFDTYRNYWDPQETIDHIGIDVNNISSGI